MVRAIVQRTFDGSHNYYEFAGLSTDSKPKAGVITGSRFLEVNTGDTYVYDESSTGTWYKCPPDPEP